MSPVAEQDVPHRVQFLSFPNRSSKFVLFTTVPGSTNLPMGSRSLNTFLIHTSQLVGGETSVTNLTGTCDGGASSFPRVRRAIGGLPGQRLNVLSVHWDVDFFQSNLRAHQSKSNLWWPCLACQVAGALARSHPKLVRPAGFDVAGLPQKVHDGPIWLGVLIFWELLSLSVVVFWVLLGSNLAAGSRHPLFGKDAEFPNGFSIGMGEPTSHS